jgi:hypothetical protein
MKASGLTFGKLMKASPKEILNDTKIKPEESGV